MLASNTTPQRSPPPRRYIITLPFTRLLANLSVFRGTCPPLFSYPAVRYARTRAPVPASSRPLVFAGCRRRRFERSPD